MSSEPPSELQDLLRLKRAWVFGALVALIGWLLVNRIIPSAPDWLPWAWAILLFFTWALFEWLKKGRIRWVATAAVYFIFTVYSGALSLGWIGQRMPLTVQELNHSGEFVLDPSIDPRAQIEYNAPQYVSDVFIIRNTADKTISFQALLKIVDDKGRIVAMTLAYGDRSPWPKGAQEFFDAILGVEQNYLLSPVTIEPGATIRGRFAFPIPVYLRSLDFKEQLSIWVDALDPMKPFGGVTYIDFRDLSLPGDRLAEPVYLLGKDGTSVDRKTH